MSRFRPYREQLLDPRWQRKRLEMLAAANWACATCGDTENTLHVHHRRYVKGRMVWEYDATELEVLCDGCHAEHHGKEAAFQELAMLAGQFEADAAMSLAAGYLQFGTAEHLPPKVREELTRLEGVHFAFGVLAHALTLCDQSAVALVAEIVETARRSDRWVGVTDEEADAFSRLKGSA